MTESEKQIVQSLQVRFHQYLNYFRSELSLPEYKFIRDMTLGILKSNSIIINKIAKYLNEKITLKKTGERLYRNLRTPGLSENLRDTLIKKQCHQVNSDTLIIVDESDIVKSRATRMEGLKLVRDGSYSNRHSNHRTAYRQGYDLLNIALCNRADEGYNLVPCCSELISQVIEPDSISQIVQDRLTDITLASGNKGIYVFDRGFDDIKLIRFLKENGNAFIIRGVGKRSIILNNRKVSFQEVLKTLPSEHEVIVEGKRFKYRCGIKRISFSLSPHPVKTPETTELWLVVSEKITEQGETGSQSYFLCDFPRHNLTEQQMIDKCVSGYILRWKLEEMHRQIKQDYGWEDLQLMSYEGLKTLNTLLWITLGFLYSLKTMVVKLAGAFPNYLIQRRRKWKDIFFFSYYRIALLVSVCFATLTKYSLAVNYSGYVNPLQLLIPCNL